MSRIALNRVDVNIALTPVTGTIVRVSIYPASEAATPAELFEGPDLQPRDWAAPAAVLTGTGPRDVRVGEFTVSTSGNDPITLTVARGGRVVCARHARGAFVASRAARR